MSYTKKSCEEFIELLGSKDPVPGGGGASALIGALGMALGNMVGSLTVGKKKYADVEQDIINLNEKAREIQSQLLMLVEKDAEVFEPLSKAYGMPKETPEQQAQKAAVMEKVLLECCDVPMQIMRCCTRAIELHDEYEQKGTAIAISDVGVGVAGCKAALKGASLNVFINTKWMTDRVRAEELNSEADEMLKKYCAKADEIFDRVLTRLV